MTTTKLSSMFPSQTLDNMSTHCYIESIPHISPYDIQNSPIDKTHVEQIGPHSYLNYVNWASLYDDHHITPKKLPRNQYFRIKIQTPEKTNKLQKQYKQKQLAKLVSKKINRNRLNKYNV